MMNTNSPEFKEYIATAIAEREINKILTEKDNTKNISNNQHNLIKKIIMGIKKQF